MRNICLAIEYDGTNYQGWQTQKIKAQSAKLKTGTIQETLEKALSTILQEKVHVQGSGRTDSGVHALGQSANFETSSAISLPKLKKALNGILPRDISIRSARGVSPDFNARFNACSKIYRYTICNRDSRPVFSRLYHHHIPYKLDAALMQKEARVLKGRHDFKSFQASDKTERTSVRTIKSISVKKRGNTIDIDVEADGFLYNMVRNIVGTLIEIGRGKFPKGSMLKILKAKDRSLAGPTAPAKGLCLMKVIY